MIKSNTHRMAYYLCAVSRYNAARLDVLMRRPVKVPPANRANRLKAYKDALNVCLEAERRADV